MSMDRAALIAAMQATAGGAPAPVEVAGWGTIYVRQLTVAEVEEQAADTEAKEDKHRIARAAARVICGADGERLFDPRSEADVALIASQPWAMLRRVLEVSEPKAGNA